MLETTFALTQPEKYPSWCNKNVASYPRSSHEGQSHGVGHKLDQFPQNDPQSPVQGINTLHPMLAHAPSPSV